MFCLSDGDGEPLVMLPTLVAPSAEWIL